MCHCHRSSRRSISPPDRRVMGLGIPDPWVQHPVLIALKSPLKVEDEPWKDQCKEKIEHQQGELPTSMNQCVHHTFGWPPPTGISEAFRQLCNCFKKNRKCPQCGCRVHKGEICSVCERSSKQSLEHKTCEIHPHHHHTVVAPSKEERPKVKKKKKKRLCCMCRSKIKKALATDAGTQTDKGCPSQKKLPPPEKEMIVCCKNKKCKPPERSKKCTCCCRVLAKEEECSKCHEPPVKVPEPKVSENHHHAIILSCKHKRKQENELERVPVEASKKYPPKESKKKICCLCHCDLKHIKVKKVHVGTLTENTSRPEKQKQPTCRKKKKTVCCKHRKELDDEDSDQSKLMNEKRLFEALYRCWNDHIDAVSPHGCHGDTSSTSDTSNPNELNLANSKSNASTMTLWSRAMASSPKGSQPPKAENGAQEKGKGIGNKEQTSGKMFPMLTKGCQTSFELLVHLIHTRRPEILRWFAEAALNEASSSNRDRTKKKPCPYHSE